jgi:hypothetical protein
MSSYPVSIVDFFNTFDDRSFSLFVRGHIFLDALLSVIMNRSYKDYKAIEDISPSFFTKVKLLKAIDRINNKWEILLLKINSTRNKLAHSLNFKILFKDAFNLVVLAHNAGVDFTDDTIFLDISKCKLSYNTDDLIDNLMKDTYIDFLMMNQDLFSSEELSNHLG